MGQLTFQATLGGAVNLAGPNTASTTTFTLPAADGTSGQSLQTNGSGTLSFGGVSLTTGVSGTLPIANGGTGSSTLAGANIAVVNVANTFTGTQTFNGTSSVLATVLANAAETTNIVAGTINANSTAYFNTGSVSYYTSSTTNNWTQNFTFSSGTTLNSAMSTGQSMTLALLATNGGTAYYPTVFTVDGNSVTPKWQGGTAPTSGNASSIDVYTYTIIKTASATFTVLASQTKFA